jgi:voltage-gated potassium channel
MNKFYQSREGREVSLLFAGIFSLLTIGTCGFRVIEGWSYFDSFYMTVITLATVGFGETHPLSYEGRWLVIGLIFLGVGTVGIAFTTLSDLIIKRQAAWVFERRKMQEYIDKLVDHTIVCGYGRLSRIAASELREAGTSLVIVDQDEARAQEAIDAGYMVVRGDVTLDETLEVAGVTRAHRLVSLLPKDADNLYVILTSRELNPKLFILSRTEDDLGEKRLRRAGADRIISPYRVGGQKIADRILRPHVTDFIDLAVSSSQGELQIEQIQIPKDSPLHGICLKDSGLRATTNVIIAAILSPQGEMMFNPSGDTVLVAGSTMIGLGLKKDLAKMEVLLLGKPAVS